MPELLDWSRRLHMRHLQWLLLLEQTGSLSEAARTAHTTQPGLSKWLRELEDDVGTPLFERHARGISPTRAGHLVLLYARRVLNAMQRAEEDVEAVRHGGLRRVMLATSPAATFNLVPDAIVRYMRLQPDIQIGLREGPMDELLVQLERVQVDVAVGRLGSSSPPPGLQYELLYVEPIVLVARPGHPLTRKRAPTWQQAFGYPWIVWPTGTPIRSNLESSLAEIGLAPPPCTVESSSMLASISLLRDSDLLLAVSAHVADHFVRLRQMARLPLSMGTAGALGMYWREATTSDPAIAGLIESLREAARQIREAG